MNNVNQNPNNTGRGPGKPPPGGGDGLKVRGPIPTNFSPMGQDLSANTRVSFNGVEYAFYVQATTICYNDRQLVKAPKGMQGAQDPGILDGTLPCVVNFNNMLCLFWIGIGNDGIWCATSSDGFAWSAQIKATGQGGNGGTQPCVVVFNKMLYLFWTSDERICYATSSDGHSWSKPSQVNAPDGNPEYEPGISDGTQPCVVVFNDMLCLFWSGVGKDGIYYATSSNGSSWSKQSQVYNAVGLGTPTVLLRDDVMYLGYVNYIGVELESA